MKILHLVGAHTDHGGILSVLRALHSATTGPTGRTPHSQPRLDSAVWVHDSFVEQRPPPLDLRRSPHALDESSSHARLLLAAARSWVGLRRLLKAESFDVIHAHSRGSFPLALVLHRLRRRDGPVVLFTNHTYAQRTRMYRAAVEQAGLPLTVLTPNMAKHYQFTHHPQVSIISECAADLHFQRPLVAPPGLPQAVRFVGIGNLVHWKKWHLLLEAWAQLPVALKNTGRCEIWGPTEPTPKGQRYAAELRVRRDALSLQGLVEFRGSTNAIAEILAPSDWFVLPSTNEPCSVALIEALATGRPALVSASGGNVDLVQAEVTGRHFEPDSVSSLTQQISRILTGERVAASPAEIRASVAHRAATPIAREYYELYCRLGTAAGFFKKDPPLNSEKSSPE